MSLIESTYKDRDTEEILDIYFYRPVGYSLALTAKKLGTTPNAVSVMSMIIGVLGGHCLFYPSIRLNVLGMSLLVFADALDSADGQLARLTGIRSRYGRILDGLVGNVIFISIYLHLCFRYVVGGGSPWIFALAVAAGVSHSIQSAMADYFRNGFLYFVRGSRTGELDDSVAIRRQYLGTNWKRHFRKKFFLRLYLTYLTQQEFLAQSFRELKNMASQKYGVELPPDLRAHYRLLNRPMVKYYNILTINTRMIVLFISVWFKAPYAFFIFELVVLNLLLMYVLYRQKKIHHDLLLEISTEETSVSSC